MRHLGRLYRVALRLLPEWFRARHGAELRDLYERRVAEAREAGRGAAARRALVELADVIGTAVRIRILPSPRTIVPRNPEGPMQGLLMDLRHAARALRLRPTFALTAMLTLGVGIGAATAIFTVADAVLLRPLPHDAPDRLVHVWRVVERLEMRRAPLSPPDFADLRGGTTAVFEELSAFGWHQGTLLGEGAPERLIGARFEGRMFGLLGARMALGRPIGPEDDRPGADPVVVLSHRAWTRLFGGDPAVLGRTIDLGETRRRVIGVAAAGFVFPTERAEYWVPLALRPTEAERDLNFLQVLGRLRPGVDAATAEDAVRGAMARIQEANPGENETDDLWVESRHAYVVGDIRPILLVLAGAVALLLVLACANLVNLLLVRASDRRHELGIRAALGAGGRRLRRALVSESLLLAAGGGVLGVGGAWAAVRLLLATRPDVVPRGGEVALDGRVLLFALAIAAASALACGWLPAWAASRRAPADAVRGDPRSGGTRRVARAQAALVVAQVAIAAVLLLGAGLLGRSFARLVSVPLGFEPDRVLTAYVALPEGRYGEPARVDAFYDDVLARISALPGVDAAGGAWALPFSPAYASSEFAPEGGGEEATRLVWLAPVRGDYFEAMGIRVLRGRALTPADHASAPQVAVINETMARLFWPDRDPIGRRFGGADAGGGDGLVTVVGVVADVKRRFLDEEAVAEAYLPQAQAAWASDLYLTVRTDGHPAGLAEAVRQQVWAVDPTLPLARVEPLTTRIAESIATERLRTGILAALAAAAALLAVIGIYGVLSFVVAERGREVAVRMALGAGRGRVLGEVVRGGLLMAAGGLLIGLAAGALGGRVLEAFLFEVEPLDPVTFLAIPILLMGGAATAAWLPARRATAIDPMEALRNG